MKKYLIIFSLLLAGAGALHAQYIEDALRFSIPNGVFTARAASLGVAYHGFNDDIASLVYNPAGIAIINKNELSVGLGFTRNNTQTDFLDVENTLKTNDEYITHIGIVSPFKAGKSSAAIGIGYFLESNFENHSDYGAFNPNSSFIYNTAVNGPDNPSDNMMWHLYLADGALNTMIRDSLTQVAEVTEGGGIHNITGSAAFNLSEYVSLGGSITGKWGSYEYSREYREIDNDNVYDASLAGSEERFDLREFVLKDRITQDITGITGKIGVLGRIEEFMRISASIQFPTFYEITEDFSRKANAYFDESEETFYETDGGNSYNVTTPFVYSAGVSLHAAGLTFAAGVEYMDVTQIEFSDATEDVIDLNNTIIRELIGQTTWGFGLEYNIPATPIFARSSYSSTTSPYNKDISNASIGNFSIGGGVLLGDNVRLDGVFRWRDNSELRTNYDSVEGSMEGARYIVTQKPLFIAFGITYRY